MTIRRSRRTLLACMGAFPLARAFQAVAAGAKVSSGAPPNARVEPVQDEL
jgi:hypothetical protein